MIKQSLAFILLIVMEKNRHTKYPHAHTHTLLNRASVMSQVLDIWERNVQDFYCMN